MMQCSVSFNNKDLDISCFVFKPAIIIIDNLIQGLVQFSLDTEKLGCVQSSVFRSIHGNMIIWFGAWQKQNSDEKEKLIINLKSMLTNVKKMAVLVEHNFLDAYAGESRDGSTNVKFCTGDIISITTATTPTTKLDDLCYSVLAIFKSRFAETGGINAGLCLKGQSIPSVVCIQVWKSLQFCYSWVLNSDHRKWMIPYLESFSINMKYDIYRIVYVSGEHVVNLPYISLRQMLKNEENRKEQVMQH
ncbi:unnamed protein product [Lupinus luteus]|uniref:DUF7392 domain-containing protein n=1 Tax=Lupinus luteus TaxID=3873 RepID=A0AAV1Y7P5_LUPLU